MGYTLTERWLLAAEVPPGKLKERHRKALERSRRFPSPVNVLYPIIVWFLNRFGPLVILSSFKRASRLSETEFEQFLIGLKKTSNTYLRGLGILAFFPLMEVLTETDTLESEFIHPLEKPVME